jgi:hypothetical protein
MMTPIVSVENIIREYIEHRERSKFYGRKKLDAEKEYNKLLAKFNGEENHYNLDQANTIYKAYQDMIINGEQSTIAQAKFVEAEEKLVEVGRILFEATINAEIEVDSMRGEPTRMAVRVDYRNGNVIVS